MGTVGGPDTAEGPTAGSAHPRTPGYRCAAPTPQDLPVVWRLALRDVLGRTTEAVIEHGGRTELAGGTVLTERYAGTVGTTQDRPGRAWATGEVGYRIDEWPEVTVATTARLDFCGDADAFDLRLDLEIRDGDETPWRRSWRRRILRRLG